MRSFLLREQFFKINLVFIYMYYMLIIIFHVFFIYYSVDFIIMYEYLQNNYHFKHTVYSAN